MLTYLKEGQVNIEGHNILEGWLTISKEFNAKYKEMKDLAVDSNMTVSVMLHTHIDEKLKQMGTAREIVNKI